MKMMPGNRSLPISSFNFCRNGVTGFLLVHPPAVGIYGQFLIFCRHFCPCLGVTGFLPAHILRGQFLDNFIFSLIGNALFLIVHRLLFLPTKRTLNPSEVPRNQGFQANRGDRIRTFPKHPTTPHNSRVLIFCDHFCGQFLSDL